YRSPVWRERKSKSSLTTSSSSTVLTLTPSAIAAPFSTQRHVLHSPQPGVIWDLHPDTQVTSLQTGVLLCDWLLLWQSSQGQRYYAGLHARDQPILRRGSQRLSGEGCIAQIGPAQLL